MDRGGGRGGTISLIRRIKLRGFEGEEEGEKTTQQPIPAASLPPHPMHEIFEMEIKSRPGRTKFPFPLKNILIVTPKQ